MADYLSDVYPIPVEFVDGQAPTAKLLNAWATQIDNAFLLMSRVIGDFDGTGEAADTYLSNIIRAIGVAGHINNRLPRGLRVSNGAGASEDLPRIKESIGALYEDKKEAELSFLPFGTEATSSANNLILDSSDIGDDLGTAAAKGDPVKTSPLNAADKWILDGRRILTSSPIQSGAKLTYAVDTNSDLYKDAYGSGTGSNVVPSLYEIAQLATLCTVTQPAGYDDNLEFKFSFPNIRRIQNPAFPQTTAEGNTIKFDDENSPVVWTGTTPKWQIPDWIFTLASLPANGGRIPAGLVGLYHYNGTAISRVRPVGTSGDLIFDIIEGDKSSIKVTLPAGFSLPDNAEPGEGQAAKYILAFAGTSVAEALLHERARMLNHKHDGQGDDSLIDAQYLTGRFDPAKWFHSVMAYNHFPQYLERGGYTTDTLNRNNALLGNLHLAQVDALPSNETSPNSSTKDSHKLSFAHSSTGPSLWFDYSDDVGNGSKLQLENYSLRIRDGGLWLGDLDEKGIGLFVDSSEAVGTILTIEAYKDNAIFGHSFLKSKYFIAENGAILFSDDSDVVVGGNPTLNYLYSGVDAYPHQWSLIAESEGAVSTQLKVGRISAQYASVNPTGGAENATIKKFIRASEMFPSVFEDDIVSNWGAATHVWTATAATAAANFAASYEITDLRYTPAFRGVADSTPPGTAEATTAPAIDNWYLEQATGDESTGEIRLLTVPVSIIETHSEGIAHALGHNVSNTVITSIKVIMQGEDIATANDNISVRLVRHRVYTDGAFDLSGVDASYEKVLYNQGQTDVIFSENGDIVAWDIDGAGTGDISYDRNYLYTLMIAFNSNVANLRVLGVEVTYEPKYL